MKSCLLNALCASLISPLLLLANNSLASTTAYFIGNSLTEDSQPNGVAALASDNGKDLTVGYHIRSGASLDYIWTHPTDITNTNSFGGFTNALSGNAWDIVTIQPFNSAGSTLASDTQRIIDLIGLNEAGPSTSTDYYIYDAWPQLPGDYKTLWTQRIPNTPDQPTTLTREYFDRLYNNVTSALGDSTSVYTIPIGEVLYNLDLLFESGAVPSFTDVSQLYRDNFHLEYDIGRWVAANTVYATIFKENPTGLQKPLFYYAPTGKSVLTDALNTQLQSVIWNVVTSDARTGVVPIPPAFYLFGSGLIGLVGMARIGNSTPLFASI